MKKEVSLIYLFKTCLFLGVSSFGGYTALIALLQKKMVDEDEVVDESLILDSVTLASMLPGPLAVNVVTFVGFILRGWSGAVISLVTILIPSYAMMIALATLYERFNHLPEVNLFLQGVIPVIAAVILSVSKNMFQKQVTGVWQYILFGLSLIVLALVGGGYWILIAGILMGGFLGMLLGAKTTFDSTSNYDFELKNLFVGVVIILLIFTLIGLLIDPVNQQILFVFSKISISLFGGGYVMIPVIHEIVVERLSWLNSQEFANAIAFGQVTPGPILVSATYIGFKVSGWMGSILATLGIFVPSAMLMIVAGVFFDYVKKYKIISAIMSGIRPVIIAFITYSSYLLFSSANNSVFFLILTLVALGLIIFSRINFLILILLGGVLGVIVLNM